MNPWHIDDRAFPRERGREQMRFLLRYATLAASSHNTQPWRFVVGDDWITLFADTTRQLLVADPERRELFLSVGCALENLVLAAEHFRFRVSVAYEPTDAGSQAHLPVATLRLSASPEPPSADVEQLFRAIALRRTPHGRFAHRLIPESLSQALVAAADALETRLVLVDDVDRKQRAAALAAEAERLQFSRPEFRRELGALVGEGAFGTPRPFAWIAKTALMRLDLGELYARRAREYVAAAPLLGLLVAGVPASDVPLWESRAAIVRAGRAYERIALLAAAHGHAVQPVSESLQIPALRPQVAGLIGVEPEALMMFFRVGVPTRPAKRHTPRREIERSVAP